MQLSKSILLDTLNAHKAYDENNNQLTEFVKIDYIDRLATYDVYEMTFKHLPDDKNYIALVRILIDGNDGDNSPFPYDEIECFEVVI